MRKFNLVDEKWIPVRFLDGSRDELGISETLLRSSEIAVIEDPSPLVVAALHRFLLAVLYRALEGPTDIEQAKALFKAGLPGEGLRRIWRSGVGMDAFGCLMTSILLAKFRLYLKLKRNRGQN